MGYAAVTELAALAFAAVGRVDRLKTLRLCRCPVSAHRASLVLATPRREAEASLWALEAAGLVEHTADHRFAVTAFGLAVLAAAEAAPEPADDSVCKADHLRFLDALTGVINAPEIVP